MTKPLPHRLPKPLPKWKIRKVNGWWRVYRFSAFNSSYESEGFSASSQKYCLQYIEYNEDLQKKRKKNPHFLAINCTIQT